MIHVVCHDRRRAVTEHGHSAGHVFEISGALGSTFEDAAERVTGVVGDSVEIARPDFLSRGSMGVNGVEIKESWGGVGGCGIIYPYCSEPAGMAICIFLCAYREPVGVEQAFPRPGRPYDISQEVLVRCLQCQYIYQYSSIQLPRGRETNKRVIFL